MFAEREHFPSLKGVKYPSQHTRGPKNKEQKTTWSRSKKKTKQKKTKHIHHFDIANFPNLNVGSLQWTELRALNSGDTAQFQHTDLWANYSLQGQLRVRNFIAASSECLCSDSIGLDIPIHSIRTSQRPHLQHWSGTSPRPNMTARRHISHHQKSTTSLARPWSQAYLRIIVESVDYTTV